MHNFYPHPVIDKTKMVAVLASQSWGTSLALTSGGPEIMNSLTALGYFGSGYGGMAVSAYGGMACLKRHALVSTPWNYLWDEDLDVPGPGLVGGGGFPANTSVSAIFTPPTYISAAELATITHALQMQGQGDEAGGIVAADGPLWRTTTKKVLDWNRTFLGLPGLIFLADNIGRAPNATASDGPTQVIREQKRLLHNENVGWDIVAQTYDLPILHEVDPTRPNDRHMDDFGMRQFGRRLAVGINTTRGTRKRGPHVTSAVLATPTRLDITIGVEAGEVLVKPVRPCTLRIEVGGVAVVPLYHDWSGNVLRAYLPAPVTAGTGQLWPVWGALRDFTQAGCIRYAPATDPGHPFYGYWNLPLDDDLPFTF